MKFLKQSALLFTSFVLVFVWQITPLSGYTVQALGVLVVLFMIFSFRRKKWKTDGAQHFQPGSLIGDNPYWSVFLLNTLVFLLVFATGGMSSSLFFLFYFVGFGIAFVFEPIVVFVYLLGTGLVLLPVILEGDVVGNAIKASSILLIGPLAYFFGREYRREEAEDEAIEALQEEAHQKASEIEEAVVEVLEEEKDVMSKENVEKLKQALKKSDELREDTKLE